MDDREVTLVGLWKVLWPQRLLIVSIVTIVAIGSIVVVLLMPPIYRSDVVLAPVAAEDSSSLAAQMGGLAALAGVRIGTPQENTHAVAILRSRAFAESFIRDHDLIKLFFADQWDSSRNKWVADDPEDVPTMFEAVEYFHENVLSISEDLATGLVTIAVEWTDPELAAKWVNELVVRVNNEARARALQEAEQNLKYLNAQLEQAKVVGLQLAISRLIENEMKTSMLATVREQYAFKVIDPGMVPTKKVRPRRALIVITSTFLGGLLSVLVALVRHSVQRQLRQYPASS